MPPAYSTEELSAGDLVRRLEERGIPSTIEQDADSWYCVFWAPRPGDGVRERVATGSAETQPLAICRALLNLPLVGSGKRLRLRRASRGWVPDESAPHPAFAGRAASADGTESSKMEEVNRPFEPARAQES
ncbi:MAG TPA: hypothetical protein VIY96_02610 [Thermoanaerobaculia bacterium]